MPTFVFVLYLAGIFVCISMVWCPSLAPCVLVGAHVPLVGWHDTFVSLWPRLQLINAPFHSSFFSTSFLVAVNHSADSASSLFPFRLAILVCALTFTSRALWLAHRRSTLGCGRTTSALTPRKTWTPGCGPWTMQHWCRITLMHWSGIVPLSWHLLFQAQWVKHLLLDHRLCFSMYST